jgi:RNA polymerase sigma-32 factor
MSLLPKNCDSIQPLSKEEQSKIAREYFVTKNKKLREKLILTNLLLVHSIAKKFKVPISKREDLIQEGGLGLILGTDKFDPNRNTSFSTYVSWWIEGYMFRFLIKSKYIFKIGTNAAQRKLFFNLSKLKTALAKADKSSDTDELAEILKVKPSDITEMEMLETNSPPIHLDSIYSKKRNGGGGELTYHEVIDNGDELADIDFENKNKYIRLKGLLEKFSDSLNDKYKTVFEYRFLREKPETFEHIRDRLESAGQKRVTKQRVQQMDAKLRKRLKKHLANNEMSVV